MTTPTPTTDPNAPRVAFDMKDGERRAIVTNGPDWTKDEQDSAILATALRFDALVHLLQEKGVLAPGVPRRRRAVPHRATHPRPAVAGIRRSRAAAGVAMPRTCTV